ncbi:hypothetical protein I6E49_11020 [Prevotella stercorea]|uniref:hypothetical protein n=1 Tax=Leyella stercorea TaxID=363265 RepID=UPI001F489BBF|nr:hypothetical protein [Leyella stercorea]MCF2645817.1 hypothetical protein [Leyella stercorea]
MLRINRYKSTLTVSLMFCLLSTMSCGFDDGYDNEDQNDDAVRVAFRMSYANGNTRAANEGWDDYDPKDDGTAYENAINTEQLQIKVCDENGTIIGDVDNVIAINNGTDTNPDYSITGTWENAADKLSKAKKIMVFANCGTSIVTPGNIQNLAFTRASTTQYIPMWGVTTLTNELVVGKSNNLGTIYLLRSLAKVKVKLADGMKSRKYSLGAMQLNNYNTSGYTLPLTYNTVASTAAIQFGNSLHANSSWAQSIVMTGDGDESIMLYIPEYDNINAAADRKATISLQLMRDGEEEGNYTLHFCNYTPEGAPDAASTYNIQRNHYYEYTVGLTDDQVKIVLNVKEWNLRQHDEIIM